MIGATPFSMTLSRGVIPIRSHFLEPRTNILSYVNVTFVGYCAKRLFRLVFPVNTGVLEIKRTAF